MTHQEAQAVLPAYFKGSLEREQVRAFHAHLKECELCQSSIRVRHADVRGRRAQAEREALPPALQAHMAKNRDLLVKVLILLALGALVFKLKR